MASSKPTGARPSFYLIATTPAHEPPCGCVSLCSTCVDSLGLTAAIRILRVRGAVGIYGSTSIVNSQALNGLRCKYCQAAIPPVRCITSSEFAPSPNTETPISISAGTCCFRGN